MATLLQDNDSAVHELTVEEAWDRFDCAAHRNLKMSGEEIIAAWDTGKFANDPDQLAVVRVVLLRPVGR